MSPGNWAPQVAGHAQRGVQKTGMDHPPSALTACRKPFEGAVDSCSAQCSLRRRPGPHVDRQHGSAGRRRATILAASRTMHRRGHSLGAVCRNPPLQADALMHARALRCHRRRAPTNCRATGGSSAAIRARGQGFLQAGLARITFDECRPPVVPRSSTTPTLPALYRNLATCTLLTTRLRSTRPTCA